MKRYILLFIFITSTGFAIAQWKSEVDKVYLDSVASRGEEGRLMNRWGWGSFLPN